VSEQSETMTPQFVLKITLRDGTEHSYGTDFRGAQFSRTGGEEPKP